MISQFSNSSGTPGLSDKIQIQRTLKAFRKRWYLPLILVFISLVFVELYSRYKTSSFTSVATIEIIEDSSPSSFLSIDLFEQAFSRTDKILTEAEVIKTKTLIMAALKKMDFRVTYKKVGTFNSYQLYRRSPVVINTESPLLQVPRLTYELEITSSDTYDLTILLDNTETNIKGTFGEQQQFKGENFSIDVSEDSYAHVIENGNTYRFNYVNTDAVAGVIQKRLQIVQPREQVSILQISFNWNNAIFAQDFLSTLVDEYLYDDYESKSEMAGNVIVFIDDQLKSLSSEVNLYETKISDFKSENTLVDIESEAGQSMRALYELETEKRLVEIELMNLDALMTQLNDRNANGVVSYSTQGLIDPTLIKSITELNRLQLEKISLAAQVGPKNKRLTNAESQIKELVSSISGNVASSIKQLEGRKQFFQKQIDQVYNEFKEIPDFQREYVNLSRNFEVNEKVFALLLEKKLSAQISKASIVPSVKLLDSPNFPLKPNGTTKNRLYAMGGMASLFLGMAIIASLSFFDDKIYNKEDLQANTKLPIIGQVTKAQVAEENVIVSATNKSRSIFSESIKGLRTNLDFFVPAQKEATRIICTTSTVSGEGKSFVTANLANSYAALGKKTILVDLDMRKPRVNRFFNVENDMGMSNLLIGVKTLDEVIKNSKHDNLDFISAGVIPPNPGELLQSDKFKEVVAELGQRYDVVMLDTPPIGIISDSLFAMKVAHTTLYVVKSNYSRVNFLSVPQELTEKHNIKNFHLLLNSVEGQRSGYGGYSSAYYYKSGYFEDEKKKGLFRKRKS